MDGFKKPRRPSASPSLPPVDPRVVAKTSYERQQPVRPSRPDSRTAPEQVKVQPNDESADMHSSESEKTPRRSPKKWIAIAFTVAVLLLACIAGGYAWLSAQLKPVSSSTDVQKVVIVDGTTFSYISGRLEERGLIRSATAFDIYARLVGKRNDIKAGTCMLNPSESAQQILDKITTGCHDFKSITFFPGATIEKPLYKPIHAQIGENMHIKGVLRQAGFSDEAINAALKRKYDSPLFAGKPAGTTLEGYVYGETYFVDPNASIEDIFATTFAQMYKDVEPLIPAYKNEGFNLYQAITMASIIQRELNCEGKPDDRKAKCQAYQETIAQIFLKRLKEGISLGSDVTFIYAADQLGIAPSVKLDSPYNTRINTGLPPGPIAVPGQSALKALANPTDTDYLYFIAGDDGLIYFAKTEAEHQNNIKEHCQKLCNEL